MFFSICHQSNLETKVKILKAIADIDASKLLGACFMIGSEASPNVVPDDSHLPCHVLLATPHADWQIAADLIKEVRLVHCIVLQEESLLRLILTVSKM